MVLHDKRIIVGNAHLEEVHSYNYHQGLAYNMIY